MSLRPLWRLGRKRRRAEVRALPGKSRAVPGPTIRRGSRPAMRALCCRSQVASHPAASSGCRPALTMPKSSSQRARAGEGL
eukprot:3749502-Lingulodinium_polyedra.AAC.1